jgi:hypothetical protein
VKSGANDTPRASSSGADGSPSRSLLAGLAVLGAVLFFVLGLDPQRSVRVSALRSEPEASVPVPVLLASDPPAVPLAAMRAELALSPPAEPRPQQTAREFLAGYYGAQWPEIEAKIEASGQGLDIPFVFTPWEDVQSDFEVRVGLSREQRQSTVRTNMHWSEPLTREFLVTTFPMPEPHEVDETDVPAIASLVAEKNERLAAVAEHFAGVIDQRMQGKWRSGDYVRAPFTTFGINDRLGFASQSHGGRGWAIALTLTVEDCPEVPALQEEMWQLRTERDELVMRYLRDKFKR